MVQQSVAWHLYVGEPGNASCYLIHQLREPTREALLHEMFHLSKMLLSVNRTCIGSADSAASLYSYDEGDPDPELKRFSIDHDREYILPILLCGGRGVTDIVSSCRVGFEADFEPQTILELIVTRANNQLKVYR